MNVTELTMETVTVTRTTVKTDLRKTVIDILRQQEGLKRQLHQLLDQLGTNGRTSIG